MKSMWALVCVAGLGAVQLVACTPKPVSADPAVEQFVEALETRNVEELAGVVDDSDAATAVYTTTYDGLQAEGLDIEVTDVEQSESVATAHYKVRWDLPRDRSLSYDTTATLTKSGDDWQVRWQPTAVHPALGAHQHLELRPVAAERASVVSSDGVELLRPGLQYRLLVDTAQVDNPRALAAKIAGAVDGVDAGELASELEGHTGTYSVGVFDTPPQISAAGVRVNEEPALVTAREGFAPDIMARVRTIVADDLDGQNGWRVSVVNQEGASLTDVEFHDSQPAPAIKVGIDSMVQQAAQEAVDLRAGSEAMLVALRPSTGEILAVAQTKKADERGDLALAGQFPPGSVFKIITAGAGLDRQGLAPETIVGCPGTLNLFGRTVTNYNGFSLGSVPLEQAFAQSCNTTFAEISTNLAEGELKAEAKRFGLGLDYDVPGLTTVTGSVPEGETLLDRTEAGYGQGLDLASPFGFALVSATVAAGKRPVPTLIEGHETTPSANPDGPSPEVIDGLRTMMRQTVTRGTARGMGAGGTLYGKTGEAEINEGSHAWFTGFREEDDIAFATLVVLGGGSEVSVAITDSFFQRLDALRAAGN